MNETCCPECGEITSITYCRSMAASDINDITYHYTCNVCGENFSIIESDEDPECGTSNESDDSINTGITIDGKMIELMKAIMWKNAETQHFTGTCKLHKYDVKCVGSMSSINSSGLSIKILIPYDSIPNGCDTCGEDISISKTSCDKCSKWWEDNPPEK